MSELVTSSSLSHILWIISVGKVQRSDRSGCHNCAKIIKISQSLRFDAREKMTWIPKSDRYPLVSVILRAHYRKYGLTSIGHKKIYSWMIVKSRQH